MAELTKEGYLEELLDIREKLRDFIDFIDKGKLSYFKDISLKLRILYCKKSGTKQLISIIEELFSFNVKVFISYTMEELVQKGVVPESILKNLQVEQVNSVVTWFERGHEIVDIHTALLREEVLYNGKKHSYKRIIEVMADKMGGAHIDKAVDDNDLHLHSDSLLLGGLPIAQRALYDLARASVQLIDIIEENFTNMAVV